MHQPNNRLFMISGPSGVGKTTLVAHVLQHIGDGLEPSISYTTRLPRSNEIHQKHYHFIDEHTFLTLRQHQFFLESAIVFKHWYGTARHMVQKIFQKGHDVLLEIDCQGVQLVKRCYSNAISIVVVPPDDNALSQRLMDRGQNTEHDTSQRLQASSDELNVLQQQADHIVVNHTLFHATQELLKILK
jgi:guanylate kinase